MALFPIYGLFEGDFVPHLVAIDTDQPMSEVAEAVAVHAVGRRVSRDPTATGYSANISGEDVPLDKTFGELVEPLAIQPLDFVTVRFAYN